MAGTGMDKTAKSVAFCGIMTALGCLFMSLAAYVQVLTYAAPLLAALLLIAVKREFGTGTSWACWCATTLLTLLLCADKEAGFFYLFFGCYPIIKERLDRLPTRLLQGLGKLLYFLFCLLLLYALIGYVLGIFDFRGELAESGLLFELGMMLLQLVTLFIYDKALNGMIVLYDRSLHKKMRF